MLHPRRCSCRLSCQASSLADSRCWLMVPMGLLFPWRERSLLYALRHVSRSFWSKSTVSQMVLRQNADLLPDVCSPVGKGRPTGRGCGSRRRAYGRRQTPSAMGRAALVRQPHHASALRAPLVLRGLHLLPNNRPSFTVPSLFTQRSHSTDMHQGVRTGGTTNKDDIHATENIQYRAHWPRRGVPRSILPPWSGSTTRAWPQCAT